MASDDSKVARIQTHFQALSSVASSLNAASDELTQVVNILDEALKKLNIGLTVWVPFRYRGDDEYPERYDQDEIGYTKIESTWGLALRRIYGDPQHDFHEVIGPWLFNDAPRELRLVAVDFIPTVVEALDKAALEATTKVREKVKTARELASALEKIANEPKGKTASKPASGGTSVVGTIISVPHHGTSANGTVPASTVGTSVSGTGVASTTAQRTGSQGGK